MLSVLVASFGKAATGVLRATIAAAKGSDPLAPVTVIVPSNYAGLSLRRVLGKSGLVNVRFLVMPRVAELLGAPSLAGERVPLTRWARAEAVRAVLVGHTGLLEKTVEHPATEAALEMTFRDLRRSPEGGLENLAIQSRRGAGIVALYRRFRTLTTGTYDAEDVVLAAAKSVRDGGEALRDIGHTILYLPRALIPGEVALIGELDKRGAIDVILGAARDGLADRELTDLAGRLGLNIPADALDDNPLHGTGILRTVDGEEEVRSVIRLIADAVATGTRLHDIGVLYPSAETYAPLLQEQFRAAGVPFSGPPTRPLSSSMAGRVLLGMLSLPGSGFRREAVMEWLTSGPIVETWEGEHPGRWVPGPQWDENSRDAGVVKGAWQWKGRLEAWSKQERTRPWERESAGRLGTFIVELERNLQPPKGAASMAELGQWALKLLDRYLGSEDTASGWKQPGESEAYEAVRKGLATIAASRAVRDPETGAELSPLAGKSPSDALHLFERAVKQAFTLASGRLGRFGEGVFIGALKDARGMEFERVFLLGMVEGVVPAAAREDPLLPDTDREHAALPSADARRAESRCDYLAALASAPERALCFPQSNLGAQAKQLPSRWLLESATALAGEEVSSDSFERTRKAPWLTAVASFEEALASDVLRPASSQEWELRSLVRSGDPRAHFLAGEPAFAASLEAANVRMPQWSRRYPLDATALSPWSGGVGPGYQIDSKSPASPTSFETFATCPFKYFLRQVGRVKETERTESIERISGAERGNIIHDALERFLSDVHNEGRSPGPAEGWTASDRERLLSIAEEECAKAYARGITGSELLWRIDRARIRRDLALFLPKDAEVRAETGGTFLEAEHSFGNMDRDGKPREDAWETVVVELPGGRNVAFRGRVDRVDRAADGRLIVYDYKSGGSFDYAAIDRGGDRLAAGTRLQLPIYAMAVRNALGDGMAPISAYYWFASEREGFKRIGYELTPADEARLRTTLGVLAGTVEAGMFPPVPGPTRFDGQSRRATYQNCQYCEFDRVCAGGDRKRAWEERKGVPELAAYVALAEPPVDAPAEEAENDA
jgi:RecB family exonuclease